MAKTVRRACAQIAILLTLFGSIQCAKSISPEEYNIIGTHLTYINPDEILRLPTQQALRLRRAAPAAPADSTPVAATPDEKNQYQSVNSNVSVAASSPGTAPNVDVKASVTGSVSYNVHNLGVNGTGQRKDLSDQQASKNSNGAANSTNATTNSNGAAVPVAPPKKTQLTKKVAASSVPELTTTERALIDDVDVSDEVITKEVANQSLTRREDYFDYYSSLLHVNKEETATLWKQLGSIPENSMLSSSHRRAMTVELKFDFPFYGHYVRNITVATGGFLYTGEYVHSWLAATQYIAPLMANFDTSISNDSFVRLQDNGSAFTVVWENVTLQDKPDYGKFTFSATLHKNGDILFAYYRLPTLITNIVDNQHPVKVGLSDAYIVDKKLYFARRKTIYEYHRVTFSHQEITNSTIIVLTAQPTCLDYTDCQACATHNTTFECAWCPMLNRCSTSNGNDRKKQDWQQKGCIRALITTIENCPALGQKGNNATQENNSSNSNNNNSSDGSTANSTSPTNSDAGNPAAVTEPALNSTHSPATGEAASDAGTLEKSEHVGAALSAENKNVGVAFGFMMPICLVFIATLWLFYAYRNPHTRSGQLLIQFRPSQWSWRRGEARYTAATIHM